MGEFALWSVLFLALITFLFRLVLVMGYITPERYREYCDGLARSDSFLKKMIGAAMRFHYLYKLEIGMVLMVIFFVMQYFLKGKV